MPKKTGTATEFILQTLRAYPDNECSVNDLADYSGGRFKAANIHESLRRLFAQGLVEKTVEGRSVWWGIKRRAGGR